jgi:hypothetical protein
MFIQIDMNPRKALFIGVVRGLRKGGQRWSAVLRFATMAREG